MLARRNPRWRLVTWVFLAFNLAMLLWLVVALDAAGKGCVGELCRGADDSGSAAGAWLVILCWLAGDVLLGIAWFVTHRTERPRRRPRRRWHRQ
ncbi:hypothetical protein AB0H86_39505 [Streptomyces sp. NPDC050997]|uniref:hypothetical protein n=1 Tax=Streptomyces sp. NPDC050997 TaxID=3155519 RepID=UPI003436AE1B